MLWHSECLRQCPACTGVQKVSRVWLHASLSTPLLCPTAHRQHLRSFPLRALESLWRVCGNPTTKSSPAHHVCLALLNWQVRMVLFPAPSGALQMSFAFKESSEGEEEWGGELPSTLQSRRRDHKEGNLPAPNSSLSPDSLGSSFSPQQMPCGQRVPEAKFRLFQGCQRQ